ncbi:hypothetical protein QC762_700005 [Podospora pseudocomata]|uniref:Extracellular membrane protein CFEM domain-containing protein n=1 Tax=Podospora pseudocomata TaxID=2093779 RepID=A0ABR0G5R5_9PEZI|nr:hypothetical protein QC762_700005 [Podospora pseudocomata]
MRYLAITANLVFARIASAQDDATTTNSAGTGVTTVYSVPPGPVTPIPTTGCPTVTVTGELCATCPILACIMVSTLTQSCDCPKSIPTVTANFPCEDNCKGLHCTTSYNIVTPSTCATINPPVPISSGNATTTTSISTSVVPGAAGRVRAPGIFAWL